MQSISIGRENGTVRAQAQQQVHYTQCIHISVDTDFARKIIGKQSNTECNKSQEAINSGETLHREVWRERVSNR